MTFTPFDDSRATIKPINATKSGLLQPFDNLRQGVEITNSKQLYGSTQPKFYSGNDFTGQAKQSGFVDHSVKIISYGQPTSFISSDETSKFIDMIPTFNAKNYIILGSNYPRPVILNGGSMQSEEAIIEPLTITSRLLLSTEGTYNVHSMHGELEDGNNFYNINKSANRVQSFVETAPSTVKAFFLDLGEKRFGGIRIEASVANIQKLVSPFDDMETSKISKSVKTNDTTFTNALLGMKINNNQDIRPFKTKSSTCGFSAVGPNFAGCDSISYNNLARGY